MYKGKCFHTVNLHVLLHTLIWTKPARVHMCLLDLHCAIMYHMHIYVYMQCTASKYEYADLPVFILNSEYKLEDLVHTLYMELFVKHAKYWNLS